MRIVRKQDAKRFENATTCTAFEYDTGTADINIARIEISGRYPEEGTAVNVEVTELVYVENGNGQVCVNGELLDISAGDAVSIEKGESVSWEGIMTLVIACAPAWNLEQYELRLH